MAIYDSLGNYVLFSTTSDAKTRLWTRDTTAGDNVIFRDKLKYYVLKNPPSTVKKQPLRRCSNAKTITVSGKTYAIDSSIYENLTNSLAISPVFTLQQLQERIALIRIETNRPPSLSVALSDVPLRGYIKKYEYTSVGDDWQSIKTLVRTKVSDDFIAGRPIDTSLDNFPLLKKLVTFFTTTRLMLRNATYIFVQLNTGCGYTGKIRDLFTVASRVGTTILAIQSVQNFLTQNLLDFEPVLTYMVPFSVAGNAKSKLGFLFGISLETLAKYTIFSDSPIYQAIQDNSEIMFIPIQSDLEIIENTDVPVGTGVTFPFTNGGDFANNIGNYVGQFNVAAKNIAVANTTLASAQLAQFAAQAAAQSAISFQQTAVTAANALTEQSILTAQRLQLVINAAADAILAAQALTDARNDAIAKTAAATAASSVTSELTSLQAQRVAELSLLSADVTKKLGESQAATSEALRLKQLADEAAAEVEALLLLALTETDSKSTALQDAIQRAKDAVEKATAAQATADSAQSAYNSAVTKAESALALLLSTNAALSAARSNSDLANAARDAAILVETEAQGNFDNQKLNVTSAEEQLTSAKAYLENVKSYAAIQTLLALQAEADAANFLNRAAEAQNDLDSYVIRINQDDTLSSEAKSQLINEELAKVQAIQNEADAKSLALDDQNKRKQDADDAVDSATLEINRLQLLLDAEKVKLNNLNTPLAAAAAAAAASKAEATRLSELQAAKEAAQIAAQEELDRQNSAASTLLTSLDTFATQAEREAQAKRDAQAAEEAAAKAKADAEDNAAALALANEEKQLDAATAAQAFADAAAQTAQREQDQLDAQAAFQEAANAVARAQVEAAALALAQEQAVAAERALAQAQAEATAKALADAAAQAALKLEAEALAKAAAEALK